MPALSFQEMWLDALLSGRKKQTTRATDRIKVGHVCSIYNQQRKRIIEKPIRQLTPMGVRVVQSKICSDPYPIYPDPPEMVSNDLMFQHVYYAHFLGKVEIVDVHSMIPSETPSKELEAWAWADGFDGFSRLDPLGGEHEITANEWFTMNYGDDWMNRTWYVIRWDGWLERYFEPDDKIRG